MATLIANELRAAQLWLLEHLGTEPRLMREIAALAEKAGIARQTFQKAARDLPILRRPRELRGPWVWRLPAGDDQVLVRFYCPLRDCPAHREGWLAFQRARQLFAAGLVTFQIGGRVRRVRSPGTNDYLLELKA